VERRKLERFLALAAMWAMPALAEAPLACDPREQPEVCALKVQRNNALDELVLSSGKTRRLEAEAAAIADYWKQYVLGVEESKKHSEAQAGVNAARAAEAAKGRVR
jgi:hypothetical protein